MRRRREEIDRVERSLRKAWKERGTGRLPSGWRAEVMDEILSLPPEAKSGAETPWYEGRSVWRFAAAAAAIVVLFAVYVWRADITGISELAIMMFEDPAGFILSPPFV